MKKISYILITLLFIAAGCSSTGKTGTIDQEVSSAKKEMVDRLVEDQKMLVKVNRFYTKRGRTMDLNPERNFIIIDKERARISLGYVGRSYSFRSIAAINMEGEVVSRSITTRNKGGYDIKYDVRQKNEKFVVNMTVSANGYVSFSIINPRIDVARYSGMLELI